MKIPGPKTLPLIGNVLDVDVKLLHISVSKLAEKFGPIFRINLFGSNFVIINDVELERKAFGCDRPDHFWGKFICFDYSSIAFANANIKTTTKRKMLHRSLKFFGDGIKRFDKINEEQLIQFTETLKLTNQSDFDMYRLVSTSLANTLAGLFIGRPPRKDDCGPIMKYAEVANIFLGPIGFLYGFFPMLRFIPGSFSQQYEEAIASRDDILTRFYFSVKDTDDNMGDGLIKTVIKLQDEINQSAGKELITENDTKGVILDIVSASQDTTMAVLANAFAIMLTHRHVAKKIQSEIETCVGTSRMPNSSDKGSMHYTMATIYEVLRYTCPGALNLPHQAAHDQNFEGYFIAKDSIILANHWYMHHNPQLWHEPWVFKPERFLDDNGKLLPVDSDTRRNLVAFSTGGRVCPGKRFAIHRIFRYLTAVLQAFDLVEASDGTLPDTDPRNYDVGIDVMVRKHFCRAIPRTDD